MKDIYKNKRKEYLEETQNQSTFGEMFMLVIAIVIITFVFLIAYSTLHI